jgi:hypothetical protein
MFAYKGRRPDTHEVTSCPCVELHAMRLNGDVLYYKNHTSAHSCTTAAQSSPRQPRFGNKMNSPQSMERHPWFLWCTLLLASGQQALQRTTSKQSSGHLSRRQICSRGGYDRSTRLGTSCPRESAAYFEILCAGVVMIKERDKALLYVPAQYHIQL